MGNQMVSDVSDRETKHCSNLWRSVKSKINIISKNRTNVHSSDDFIIKYKHTNRHKEKNIDINSFDERRIVFVSLIGFYQTWQECPSHKLYTCLLLLPLKQKWIYNPKKYIDELKHCFASQLSFFSDAVQINSFIELLKWKDSQCSILWLLADGDTEISFWYSVSKQLTDLNYKPLNLNKDHRENKKDFLKEVYSMKFKAMQEIICESNPNSFNPIRFYGETHQIQSHEKTCDIYDEFDEVEVENWWVSQDYDPNDIDGQ